MKVKILFNVILLTLTVSITVVLTILGLMEWWEILLTCIPTIASTIFCLAMDRKEERRKKKINLLIQLKNLPRFVNSVYSEAIRLNASRQRNGNPIYQSVDARREAKKCVENQLTQAEELIESFAKLFKRKENGKSLKLAWLESADVLKKDFEEAKSSLKLTPFEKELFDQAKQIN